jgi:HPr kinase/phosphorylase
VGILLLGKSGIGKSECALELVMRGHRIVADDVVRCEWRPPGVLLGQPAELLRHHIEIRGLGVLDIRELFGVTAVCEKTRIDLAIRLCEWTEREEFDRLGIEERHYAILDTQIRELRVPVRPGRNMASLIEMAARNEMLRRAGRHTALEFLQKIEGHMQPEGGDSEPLAPARDIEESKPATWSTLAPNASGTESSAWIPAVRPPREGHE